MKKCSFGDGVEVKIGGVPVDPCCYEVVAIYKNVTVEVLRCKDCGHEDFAWYKQENTEEGDLDGD